MPKIVSYTFSDDNYAKLVASLDISLGRTLTVEPTPEDPDGTFETDDQLVDRWFGRAVSGEVFATDRGAARNAVVRDDDIVDRRP